MKTPLHFLLLSVLCCLLTLSTTGCGEIDLPLPETPGSGEQTGNTSKPNNPEKPDEPDAPDTPDEPDTPDSPDTPDTPDNPDTPDEPDTPGNGEEKPNDITIGTVCLTADRHLLIANSLYLSLTEYWNVPSALSTKPDAAQKLATAYTEGDLEGWRIPTRNDAEIIRTALACQSPYYGEEVLPQINKLLDAMGCLGIYRERYLCDGAAKTFDFAIGSNISAASKSKTYRLRLVRDK